MIDALSKAAIRLAVLMGREPDAFIFPDRLMPEVDGDSYDFLGKPVYWSDEEKFAVIYEVTVP